MIMFFGEETTSFVTLRMTIVNTLPAFYSLLPNNIFKLEYYV